jgi:hypothetical protein
MNQLPGSVEHHAFAEASGCGTFRRPMAPFASAMLRNRRNGSSFKIFQDTGFPEMDMIFI